MPGHPLDPAAQRLGYKNYEQMAAFQAHQQMMRQGPSTTPAAPNNWLQNLMESIPGHPAMLMRYVSDNLNSALGPK